MTEDAGSADDLVVVEEGLAHYHAHDAPPGAIRLSRDGEHLSHDLRGLEVALYAELAGGAERAGERAARLGRDADDVLLLLVLVGAGVRSPRFAGHRNAHGLDARAVAQLEQVLDESVGGGLARGHLERLGGAPGLDALEQLAPDTANRSQGGLAPLHCRRHTLAAHLPRPPAE